MEILFSPYFDQPVYFEPSMDTAWFNKTIAGPVRLLAIFEQHLGFTGKYFSQQVRIGKYRRAIEKVNDVSAFYYQSFNADPSKSARTLLKWRDELIMGGMDLLKKREIPARLKALQEIEIRLSEEPYMEFAGEADRWKKVADALESNKELTEMNIEVLYPKEYLNMWEKKLMSTCEIHRNIKVTYREPGHHDPTGDTDLDLVKRHAGSGSKEKLTLNNDSSLIIIHTTDPFESGQVLSRYLAGKKDLRDVTLVSRNDLKIASGIMDSHGVSSGEINGETPQEYILQLLKLIPVCVYYPLDVTGAMELLTFQYVPFDRKLAYRLARLMNSKPGRGSESWNQEIENWRNEQVKEDEKEGSLDKKIERIRFYLESELYRESDISGAGRVKARIIELLKDVAEWSNAMASVSEDEHETSLYYILKDASERLIRAINDMDAGIFLTRLRYEQLLKELLYPRRENLKPAYSGSAGHAGSGSNILHSARESICWNCIRGENPDRQVWLPEEARWLKDHDIPYNDPSEEFARRFHNDEEILMRTTERLILFVPEMNNGEAAEKGNLYSRLKGICSNLHEVEYRFPEERHRMKDLFGIETGLPDQLALPDGKQEYWIIKNKHLLRKRDKESYSSLSNLFFYPYHWVLYYMAHIRSSVIVSDFNEAALKGTLAHRMLELTVKASDDPLNLAREEINVIFDRNFMEVMKKEGALYLMADRVKELSYFEYLVKRAVISFLGQCRENGWNEIETERTVSGRLGDLEVESRPDILLKKDNDTAVVDIKFFNPGRRKTEMSQNADLQLIFYSGLARGASFFPYSAYYIVQTGKFLAKHRKAFGDAVLAGNGEDQEAEIKHLAIWEQMKRTAIFRLSELCEHGKIEVADDLDKSHLDYIKAEKDELLPLPKGKPASNKAPRSYNDYINLIKVN